MYGLSDREIDEPTDRQIDRQNSSTLLCKATLMTSL